MKFVEFQKDSGRALGTVVIFTTCDALDATHFIAKLSKDEQKYLKHKEYKRFTIDSIKLCNDK